MAKFKSIGAKIVIYLRPFANWRFLISFGAAWVITNGIWYVLAFAQWDFIPNWLKAFSAAYISILWLPTTPEKFFITLPLAIWIHVRLFKNDEKTHLLLLEMKEEAKNDWEKIKNKFKKKKP